MTESIVVWENPKDQQSFLEYEHCQDGQTNEPYLLLTSFHSFKPGDGKELIKRLITQVGHGNQVRGTVIEKQTRDRLIQN